MKEGTKPTLRLAPTPEERKVQFIRTYFDETVGNPILDAMAEVGGCSIEADIKEATFLMAAANRIRQTKPL